MFELVRLAKVLVIWLACSEMLAFALILVVLGMAMAAPEAFKQALEAVRSLFKRVAQ